MNMYLYTEIVMPMVDRNMNGQVDQYVIGYHGFWLAVGDKRFDGDWIWSETRHP